MTSRALAFVQSIMARRVMGTRAHAHLARTLVRRARIVIRVRSPRALVHAPRRHQASALRLHLTLRLSVDREATLDATRAGEHVLPQQRAEAVVLRRATTERLVERIVRRTQRLERSVLRSATTVRAPVSVHSQVLRQQTLTDAPPVLRRAAAVSPVTTLDAREVSRVADAVMHSLEHRLAAHRERRGRV
jgi:hypothetical protein